MTLRLIYSQDTCLVVKNEKKRGTLGSVPLYSISKVMLSSVGVEPTTLGLLDPRSNQLSYEDFLVGIHHIENYIVSFMKWKIRNANLYALVMYTLIYVTDVALYFIL
jgi:hypothetical protein